MNDTGLTNRELDLLRQVFRRFPKIRAVILFGSRAKGTHHPGSDIDLALVGPDDDLQTQAIAEALDLLPLPYRFDLKTYENIRHPPLLEHIERVGISIYPCERPSAKWQLLQT